MSSLNPCFTVGYQLGETLRIHMGLDRAARRARSIELLTLVGIPAPRTGSAISRIRCRAHEPARDDRHGACLQSETADRRRADHGARRHHPGADPRSPDPVAGRARHGAGADHTTTWAWWPRRRARAGAICRQKVEEQPVKALFRDPHHPYTAALLASLPERARVGERLPSIQAWCPASMTGRKAVSSRRAAPLPPTSVAAPWSSRGRSSAMRSAIIPDRRYPAEPPDDDSRTCERGCPMSDITTPSPRAHPRGRRPPPSRSSAGRDCSASIR